MTRKSSKTKTVIFGWCDRGCVGARRFPLRYQYIQDRRDRNDPGIYTRVRITVEQVFDKRGRAIERVVR